MTKFVWDWDGTLADTYPVTNAAYAYTFKMLDLEDQTISFDEVKRITGAKQNKDVLGCIFGDKKDTARKYFYDYVGKFHADKLETIKGAVAIMEYCNKNGIESYLLSNKTNKTIKEENREPYLTQELKKLGMAAYFTHVVGAGEHAEDKPAPIACFSVFGGKENLPPKDELIVVVGDGEADVKVAKVYKEAGLNAVSVLYDPKNKYKGIPPDYIIHNLNTIPIIIHNEENGTAQKARRQMNNNLIEALRQER